MMLRATMTCQEQSPRPPSYSASHPSPSDHVDEIHGTSQGRLSDTSLPQLLLGSHHTQSSPLISVHPAVNSRGAHNSGVSYGFPLLVRQAVQEFIGIFLSSIQPPALSLQAGLVDFPIRSIRVGPFGRSHQCETEFGRSPTRWIHCPAPDCSWRGDRLSAFARHWDRDHPVARCRKWTNAKHSIHCH